MKLKTLQLWEWTKTERNQTKIRCLASYQTDISKSLSCVRHGRWPARLLHPWDSPGKNTGVCCHSLLQGIFPTQGSNPGLPHCRQTLYHLNQQGSPCWKRLSKSPCACFGLNHVPPDRCAGDPTPHSENVTSFRDKVFTEVGEWVHTKSLQSCLTLCDLTDSSPPGSSIHGILQARLLEWVAMPSSRGSSQSRDPTSVSYVSWQETGTSTLWKAPFTEVFKLK